MNPKSIWCALEASFWPLNDDVYAIWQKIAAEQGLEPGWMVWLASLFIFGAEPFTTAGYVRLFPYGSAHVIEARLELAVKNGILVTDSENEYQATAKGLEWKKQMIHAATAFIAQLQSIPESDLQKIVSYLKRLV